MDVFPKLLKAHRIIIIGCGTSWHAALVGEYLIETYARIQVEVEYASEFRYRNPILTSDDVVIAISQSGETADTLAALRLAKENHATVLGICNVVGSTIARETEAGVYTHAGVEIGVASTKAFTAQVTVLTLLALKLAKDKGEMNQDTYLKLIMELVNIPGKVQSILVKHPQIKKVAEKYKNVANALYLGRGSLFPVALEGALKLKEISYVHAEGYAAGEMKHGPIALVDDTTPEAIPYLWTDAVPFFAAYFALLSAQAGARQAEADRMFARYQEFTNRARRFATPSVLPFIYPQSGNPVQANQLGLQPAGGGGGQ